MAPLKKHLTPIGKGGIQKHAGKGSQATLMPARQALNKLQNTQNPTMNDYSKTDPQSEPAGMPSVPSGIGTGDFTGIGD